MSAAFVDAALAWGKKPRSISVTAYEVEPVLVEHLESTFEKCRRACSNSEVEFSASVIVDDFIESGVEMLQQELFSKERKRFDYAIMNPPYKKIHSQSRARKLLRNMGVETSNLYTAFLAVAIQLLEGDGELVSITPRSFCNGPYFKPFRALFLNAMSIREVHVFESRNKAFREDEILQENVIVHSVKAPSKNGVLISSSMDAGDVPSTRTMDYHDLVHPEDPEQFIHIVSDGLDHAVIQHMQEFSASLGELGLSVSTGRVVDFRAREYILQEPGSGTVPLLYPSHFRDASIEWPKPDGKKPNAILDNDETSALLIPVGIYVLCKRFSAKEEPRRVVAAVCDTSKLCRGRVGIENHINYFHEDGHGLDGDVATGLAAFLNSTMVDLYFRTFSGHTQVNATDLRRLGLPNLERLQSLGRRIGKEFPGQDTLDRLCDEELLGMAKSKKARNPISAKKLIGDSLQALKELGMPSEQLNERSALTLLSLLDLKPGVKWRDASNPQRGITDMMAFFQQHYRRKYAPNTRETVRRFTVHQFLDAGLVVANPDQPDRPINSPKTCYQIEARALRLLRTRGTDRWRKNLSRYLKMVGELRKKYAQERTMARIPVKLPDGERITLTPGGQNALLKRIIEAFCPRFAPGAKPICIGDAGDKWAYVDNKALAALGVKLDEHGKMPDLVVYFARKKWILLVEAVTSHGPVNPKRHRELKRLFRNAKKGLVFVTAFETRKAFTSYLSDISWETEVWIAEDPTHMIHFDGKRFLGPYE